MRRVVLILALLLASGCATVTSGPAETIVVTSEPSGADVLVDCGSEKLTLVTPARFVVARKSPDCSLTIQTPGFERETAVLEQGVNRWTWGNIPIAAIGITALGVSGFTNDSGESVRIGGAILLAGLGGLVVDRMTWRLRDHDPKTLHVKLRVVNREASARY